MDFRLEAFTCDDLRIHCSGVFLERLLFPRPDSACLGVSDGDVGLFTRDDDALGLPFQAVVTDYEWSSDCGVSWWVTPLAFGPVREVSNV
jgi:hypothetical protein